MNTDAEFLLDIADRGEVSGHLDRQGQAQDVARIKSIANRLENLDHRVNFNTRINNPNDYTIKYGKDHGESITRGELVDKLIDETRGEGVTDKGLVDLVDREFLFGCWANELEMRSPDLIRDLRGLIISLLRKAAGQPETVSRTIRGVDFACESCLGLEGSFYEDGFHRCNKCGYPNK